jgi:hypothetical protein
MAMTLTKEVLDDELAVSLARAVAAANARAKEEGLDLKETLVTVAEQGDQSGMSWRINCGPRNYVGRRGGDLIVEVGWQDAQIKRVLRGQ